MIKEKINVNQTAFFCFIVFFASKLLILPALFFKENEYGGILCIVTILVVELLILYLIIKIKEKYVNLSFYEILSSIMPKVLVKIMYFILFAFLVLKLIYVISESYSFLKVTLFEDATLFVFFVCLIPVINSLVYKGLQAFARSLEIFFYLIVAGLILSATIWVSSLTNFGFNIFQNNGFMGFLGGIYNYSFWFCDFIFLIIIIDRVKIENNFGRKLMNYSIFACSLYIFFIFSFYYVFQDSSFFHTSAIYEMTQFSTRIGNVGKLDFIAIGTIMFLFYYQCAMFLYCANDCLKKVLITINDAQSLIIINILFLLLYYILFQNIDNIMIFSTNYLRHFSAFVGYVIPIILTCFYFFKDKSKSKFKVNKKMLKNSAKY